MALIICTECGKEFSDKATACPNCGCPTSEIKNSTYKTQNIKELNTGLGKIIAYNNYLEITPLDFRVLGRNSRIIYYKNISAISYRPTSFSVAGYIQFILNGSIAREVNILKKGWDKELAKDENTVLIKYSMNKKFKKECNDFVEYLSQKIGI